MPARVVFGFDRQSQTGQYYRQTGKKLGLRKWRALHQMAWSSRSGSIDLFKILFYGFCQKKSDKSFELLRLLLFFLEFVCILALWILKERQTRKSVFLYFFLLSSLLGTFLDILGLWSKPFDVYKPNFLQLKMQ